MNLAHDPPPNGTIQLQNVRLVPQILQSIVMVHVFKAVIQLDVWTIISNNPLLTFAITVLLAIEGKMEHASIWHQNASLTVNILMEKNARTHINKPNSLVYEDTINQKLIQSFAFSAILDIKKLVDIALKSIATLFNHCLTEKNASTNGINVKQDILQCLRLLFHAIYVILNMLSKTENAFHKYVPKRNRNSMELIVYSHIKVV